MDGFESVLRRAAAVDATVIDPVEIVIVVVLSAVGVIEVAGVVFVIELTVAVGMIAVVVDVVAAAVEVATAEVDFVAEGTTRSP